MICLARVLPNGWPINMFVVPLRDGGTLIYSPHRLAVSHGETLESDDLVARLVALVEARV